MLPNYLCLIWFLLPLGEYKWKFFGNGHTTRLRKELSLAQDEDTVIVSDTTDDLWFLNESESEQVSVEMKETVLHPGSDGELHEEEEGAKKDKEVCNGFVSVQQIVRLWQ